MSNVSAWNVSAASNNAATPNGWPEGQSPSSVNDCAREMMGALARWYQDTDGGLVTAGSDNAYTLTTNNTHASLGAQSFLVFRADRANTGAATLNVDSLGALALRHYGGNALVSGSIVADTLLLVAYNATDSAYDIIGGTVIDAAAIGTGDLADARLSANVALLNAANGFTQDQTVSKSQARVIATATDDTIAALRVNTNSNTRGFVGAGTDLITGIAASAMCVRAEAGGFAFSGDGGSTAHLALSAAGVVTTPNLSAGEVGTKGLLQNSQNADYTLVLTDAGKQIYCVKNGAQTLTIPANASVAFPLGTVIRIINNNADGSSDLSIAITTDDLYQAGTAFGTTGTRTLAWGGAATIEKFGSTQWLISGAGLT